MVLAMLTIRSRLDWEMVRRNHYAYRHNFTDAVRRQIGGEKDALENLAPELRAIPPRFLQYVGPAGPAEDLLTIASIDEYIYAGEATHSRFGVGLSDLVRDATTLRGLLRDAAEVTADDEKASQIRGHILQLRERIMSLSQSSGPGGFSNAILRHLDELTDTLEELPDVSADREPWLRRGNKLVDQTVSDIDQWSRWG